MAVNGDQELVFAGVVWLPPFWNLDEKKPARRLVEFDVTQNAKSHRIKVACCVWTRLDTEKAACCN